MKRGIEELLKKLQIQPHRLYEEMYRGAPKEATIQPLRLYEERYRGATKEATNSTSSFV